MEIYNPSDYNQTVKLKHLHKTVKNPLNSNEELLLIGAAAYRGKSGSYRMRSWEDATGSGQYISP